MNKIEALEVASRVQRARYGIKTAQDDVVDLACRLLLEEAGVGLGRPARVIKGRRRGLQGSITAISWSEAEVQIGNCPRWFGLWHGAEFEVL